ncbi:MAG: hypothetical protein AAGA44_03575 [Pseudomonadota bacterium]
MAEDSPLEFSDRDYAIAICTWMSALARDVMQMRQDDKPQSDTLPMALSRIDTMSSDMIEQLLSSMGVELDDVLDSMSDDDRSELEAKLAAAHEKSRQVIVGMDLEPRITRLVERAYELPVLSSREEQAKLVDTVEKGVLDSCAQRF